MKITTHINHDYEETHIDITSNSMSELNLVLDAIQLLDDSIIGKVDDQVIKVYFHQIYYFENVEKCTFAYTERKIVEVSMWLSDIEKRMPPHFFRCSKNCIVNLSKVKSFSPSFGSRILMNLSTGEKLVVSRKYVKALYEILEGEKI